MLTTLDGPDAELRWPPDLFAVELADIQRTFNGPLLRPAVSAILRDAFASPMIAAQWDAESPRLGQSNRPMGAPPAAILIELQKAHQQGKLRERPAPAPYRSRRTTGSTSTLRSDIQTLLVDLDARGYFAAGSSADDQLGTQGVEALLHRQLDRDDLDLNDDDDLLDAIEAAHDLVARPRIRQPVHNTDGHARFVGSHYTVEAARLLYRAQINTMFERHESSFRVADDGEDTGRLVEHIDDAREDLIRRARAADDPDRARDIDHAVATYRARDADIPAKRSALVTLAGILEANRALLKDELPSKDEGALFEIANKFAIRHRDASQRDDYDPIFLDWIFWKYLATVELIERLLQRQTQH